MIGEPDVHRRIDSIVSFLVTVMVADIAVSVGREDLAELARRVGTEGGPVAGRVVDLVIDALYTEQLAVDCRRNGRSREYWRLQSGVHACWSVHEVLSLRDRARVQVVAGAELLSASVDSYARGALSMLRGDMSLGGAVVPLTRSELVAELCGSDVPVDDAIEMAEVIMQ